MSNPCFSNQFDSSQKTYRNKLFESIRVPPHRTVTRNSIGKIRWRSVTGRRGPKIVEKRAEAPVLILGPAGSKEPKKENHFEYSDSIHFQFLFDSRHSRLEFFDSNSRSPPSVSNASRRSRALFYYKIFKRHDVHLRVKEITWFLFSDIIILYNDMARKKEEKNYLPNEINVGTEREKTKKKKKSRR